MSNIVLDETQLGRLWNKCLNTFELRGGYSNATVLWTNSNPTSDFASSTITCSSSVDNYKYIIIEWKMNKTFDGVEISTVKNLTYNSTPTSAIDLTKITYNYGITEAGGAYIRNINRVANNNIKLTFTDCTYQRINNSYTTANYSCIPVRILGCNELKPTLVSNYVDTIYPVGAIYISTDSTSPASLFGGSWTKIHGKFLLGNTDILGEQFHPELATLGYLYGGGTNGWYWKDSDGNKYSISVTSSSYATTAGEVKHTLTTNEMPSHSHSTSFYHYSPGSGGINTAYNVAGGSLVGGDYPVNNTGGDSAHNNMPPYLLVYMWKRTA